MLIFFHIFGENCSSFSFSISKKGQFKHLNSSDFSSKFTSERNIFTNLERRNQEQSSSEPITFEPTTTGAKYIFSLNGQISENELQNNADDEEENTDSSGEDAESDGETEVHTTTMRANKFPKVVFFGTGSTFPGVTKTATAILVHTA